jgi:hypothetical protein
VSDGARTRDILDHNQVLYQLSYTHHEPQAGPAGTSQGIGVHATGADTPRRTPFRQSAAGSEAGVEAGSEAGSDGPTSYVAASARAASESSPGCGTNTAAR